VAQSRTGTTPTPAAAIQRIKYSASPPLRPPSAVTASYRANLDGSGPLVESWRRLKIPVRKYLGALLPGLAEVVSRGVRNSRLSPGRRRGCGWSGTSGRSPLQAHLVWGKTHARGIQLRYATL